MKIKVWAFVLIVTGAVALGGLGGFAVSQGVSLAGNLVRELKAGREAAPRVEFRLPGGMRQFAPGPGWGMRRMVPKAALPGGEAALPPGFNAGVSISGTYGEMTGRTEEQVVAAAKEANTNVWGLAQKEGKLDELKAKLVEKVTASLDKMITDGKITKEQKEAYLEKVNFLLKAAGLGDAGQGGFLPFGGEPRNGCPFCGQEPRQQEQPAA